MLTCFSPKEPSYCSASAKDFPFSIRKNFPIHHRSLRSAFDIVSTKLILFNQIR